MLLFMLQFSTADLTENTYRYNEILSLLLPVSTVATAVKAWYKIAVQYVFDGLCTDRYYSNGS
jgi:hypothetical protein